jgi:hypothetical protein
MYMYAGDSQLLLLHVTILHFLTFTTNSSDTPPAPAVMTLRRINSQRNAAAAAGSGQDDVPGGYG